MAVPTREELERAQQIVEAIKEQNRLLAQQNNLQQSNLDALESAVNEVQRLNNLREQESATFREQLEYSNQYYQSIKDIGKSLDNGLLKNQALAQIERDKIALIQDQIKQGQITQQQAQDEIQASNEILSNLKAKEQRINNVRTQIERTSIVNSKFVQATLQLGTAFKEGGITTGFKYIGSLLMGPILSGVRMLVSSFKQLFFELDTTTSQFMTATGMNREFTMSLEGTARQLQRDATTTLPEYYAATQQMITGVTDFTMASRQQQETMAQTATMLERVGVSTQDFAAGAQNSIKMFSMSMNEASSFASELTQTAKALGVTPQQMASDFAQVGGSLAKLGSEGPRAFKELARVSKLTGLEISKLINLTSKFDTFEDAATMTGQLNAALGGNFVNAMDMMMTTDPVQRFEMLRDAISSTGLTFDEMSYYQRQFFANAMGLESVGDLALMMSGNMDLMSGATQQSAADYEKMAEEAAATADLQRLFNSVLAEMAPMMGEILIAVRDFMMGLKENEALLADIRNAFEVVGGVIKFVIENIEIMTIAFLGLAAVGPILKTIELAMLAVKGATALATSITGFFTKTKAAETPVLNKNTGALNRNSSGMQKSGKMGGGAAAGLMKFALAVLAIGGGIFLAGEGISAMADGFVKLFDAASADQIFFYAGSLSTLALASTALAVGAIGLGLFAGAMVLLGGSLALIKTADLEAIATFASALAEMETNSMATLAETIEDVAKAMNQIPEKKAFEMTTIMNAVTSAAKAVAGAPAGTFSKTAGTTGKGITSGGDLGTLTIKFDSPMFKNQVIKIATDNAGKIVAEAQRDER